MYTAYIGQTGTIVITFREFTKDGITENKTFVRESDPDFDTGLAWCKERGLL